MWYKYYIIHDEGEVTVVDETNKSHEIGTVDDLLLEIGWMKMDEEDF